MKKSGPTGHATMGSSTITPACRSGKTSIDSKRQYAVLVQVCLVEFPALARFQASLQKIGPADVMGTIEFQRHHRACAPGVMEA